MLFNSYVFLFAFFPAVLVGWWVVFRRDVPRLAFLTLASYVFYSYFQFPRGLELLPLLLMSTTADYVAGRSIFQSENARIRKMWLIGALSINLALLGFFKYLGFFESTVDDVLSVLRQSGRVPIHHLILPIGISFYTFNSMSYTIDIYRRNVQPAKSFLHYATFVALFPHLIAGPIVRYSIIDRQLRNLTKRLTPEMASVGVYFLVCGLFKKLVIADTLATTVDRLFAVHSSLTFVSGWAAALGYAFQIYFDFSGYSDMAVGLAFLLGFRFPQNFNSPYKAVGVADFWDRWHMTLSRWMRDYLFIQIGGARGTFFRTSRNLMITFFLVGLWHGASWTFGVWGLHMGVWLSFHHYLSSKNLPHPPVWVRRTKMFILATLSLVLYRAPTIGVAGEVYSAVTGFHGFGWHDVSSALVGASVPWTFFAEIAALLVFVNIAPNTWEYRFTRTRVTAAACGLGFVASVLLLGAPSPFLYFRF